MAAIKAIDQIAAKWSRVASASQQSYQDGVMAPRADWAQNAAAAEGNYAAGVQAAVGKKSFSSGVRRAGTSKWQNNAQSKGPARYSQGVQVAQGDYAAGFTPYREAIQSAQLPPRGPRRSPQNLQRVAAIVAAVSARKEALLKGGQ